MGTSTAATTVKYPSHWTKFFLVPAAFLGWEVKRNVPNGTQAPK